MATATTTEGGDSRAKTVAKQGWVKGKAGFDWVRPPLLPEGGG